MRNGKKKIVVLLFIILLLVLVACLGVYAYITTDIFKTSKQLFGKYLGNNIEQIENANIKPFDEILDKTNLNQIIWNLELKLDKEKIPISSLFNNDEESLDTLKVSLSSKNDVSTKSSMLSLDAEVGEYKLIDYDFVYNNDTLGIKIPELSEKYLALENRDLKDFAKNLGVDDESLENIPDKIEITENEGYTEEDIQKIKDLKEKYSTKISEQLSEDKFSEEKNVNVDVNGENYVANKYTFTISYTEACEILKNTLDDLMNDEDFIYIYEKVGDKSSLENIKTSLEEFIKETSENTEIELIQVSVYAKNGKTIKTEISTNTATISLIINNQENESTISIILDSVKDDNNKVGSQLSCNLNNKYENNQGTLTLECNFAYNQDDIEALKANNDSDDNIMNISEDDEDEYVYDNEEDEVDYDEKYKDLSYTIKLVTTKTDDNNARTNITLSNKELFDGAITIKKNEIQYKLNSSADIDELNEDTALIVNDYNKDKFTELLEDILQNIEKSAEENPYTLIGIIYNTYSNYNTIGSASNIDDVTDEEEEVNTKAVCSEITTSINLSLVKCLTEYKTALNGNPDESLSSYLTIENIIDNCLNPNIEDIELIDGTTLKCKYNENAYYIRVDINADTLQVNNVQTYTEDEFEELN
jgi:hypothetical protein